MASKQNKKMMSGSTKTKMTKNKVTAFKPKVKTVVAASLGKKQLTKEKKARPAPITEPGYSLYSTESENTMTSGNTWEQDACFEVLKKLREKKGGDNSVKTMVSEMDKSCDISQRSTSSTDKSQYSDKQHVVIPSGAGDETEQTNPITAGPKAHFNERLSSSTPDPERVSPDKHYFQLIPERDTTHTVKQQPPPNASSMYTNQWMAGHLFSNPTQLSLNQGVLTEQGLIHRQMIPGGLSQNVQMSQGHRQITPGGPSQNIQMVQGGTSQNAHSVQFRPTHSVSQPVSNMMPVTNQAGSSRQTHVTQAYQNRAPFSGYSQQSMNAIRKMQPKTFAVQSTQNGSKQGAQLVQTSSEGFLPSSDIYFESTSNMVPGRDSDIGALQAFIPRDSLGFSPMGDVPQTGQQQHIDGTNLSGDSRKVQSGSSGEKSLCSQGALSTPNTSGTDYVGLPTPKGDKQVANNVVPSMQKENGLFQIHAHVPNIHNIQNENRILQVDYRNLNMQHLMDGQIQSNPYQGEKFEIPVRDTEHGNIHSISAATGSNRSNDITPDSQRISSITSPGRSGSDHHGTNGSDQHGNSGNEFPGSDHATPHGNQEVKLNKQTFQQTPLPFVAVPSAGIEQGSADGHCSSRSGTNSQASLNPGSAVIQPVVVGYTTNGAQLIPVRIPTENLHGIPLAGYGVPATFDGNVGSQHQILEQAQPLQTVVTPQIVSVAAPSVSSGSDGDSKQKDKATEAHGDQGITAHQQPNPWSKVKTDTKLKRVRYLLKELHECGKISKDVEVQRLSKDIEKNLDKVPQLSGTFSLQAEIDLALQPLRSENSQLRRRLRLLNQQLKDQEIETDKIKKIKAVDLDVLHLQGSNTALQKLVADLREDKVKLATEVTELNANIQKMKIDRNKLLASCSEKETEDFRIKQECLSEAQKYRDETEKYKRLVESSHLKHQAAEQECHILQITLQQRDTEINRLQEIVQTMKEGMAELLQELEHNKTMDKSWRENSGFGLQKLVRILEEDKPVSPSRTVTSDPGRASSPTGGRMQTFSREPNQNARDNMQTQHQILTQQALANHNRLHSDRAEGKVSTSDTEAEMIELDVKENRRRRSPRRRRHSHSPQARRDSRKHSRERHHDNLQTDSGKYVGQGQIQNVEDIFHMLPKDYSGSEERNIINTNRSDPASYRASNEYYNVQDNREAIEGQSEGEGEVENESDELYYVVQPSGGQGQGNHLVYLDQSRYSVTDYFRKYSQKPHQQKDTNSKLRSNFKPHRRSLSQPDRRLHSNVDSTDIKHVNFMNQEVEHSNGRKTHHTRSNSQDAYISEQTTEGESALPRTFPNQQRMNRNIPSQNVEQIRNLAHKPSNTVNRFSNHIHTNQVSDSQILENNQFEVQTAGVNKSHKTDNQNSHRQNFRNLRQIHERTHSEPNYREVQGNKYEGANTEMQEQFEDFPEGYSGGQSEDVTPRRQLHFDNNRNRYEQDKQRRQGQSGRTLPQGHRYGSNSQGVDLENRIQVVNRNLASENQQRPSLKKQNFTNPAQNSRNVPQGYSNVYQGHIRITKPQGHNIPQGYNSRLDQRHSNMIPPQNSSKSPQESHFHGTVLDNSISAIVDEDNVSSVSANTATSSSTVDDSTFRKGIATLDANILKLQLALQKTKKMLS